MIKIKEIMKETKGKKTRKSQVALFLIIGLVVLAGSFFIYYVAKAGTVQEKIAPPEIAPIKNYVESCAEQIAVEGLKKLGEHGGYIQPENPELSKRTFSIAKAGTNPTEADGVSFGTEDSAVPYWYYLKSKNDCTRCTLSEANIPSIAEIEQQLNDYAEENFNSCINDFKMFREKKYEIMQVGKRTVKTTITDNEIIVNINFPLQVKLGEQQFLLADFSTVIPYNFKRIYNQALTIVAFEEQTQALEFLSMRIVSAFSAPDPSKLPPIVAVDESYSYATWTKPAVENQLTNLLTTYSNSIVINNSGKVPLKGDNDVEQKFYDSMYWSVFNETINESIELVYANWLIYFDITPRNGFSLKPSSIKHSYPQYLPPVQTNYYEFYYDISYPVVVIISDDNAPFENSYKFMFAMESNVRDNKNMQEWLSGNGTISWNPSFVTLLANSQSGISQSEINKLDIPSLMCDDQQRLSGDITIKTYDAETKKELQGVSVTFGCGAYKSCPYEPTNLQGIFFGKLPICAGSGYLLLEKEGYRQKVIPDFSTQPNQNKVQVAELEKYKKIKVEAKVVDILFDYSKGIVYPSEPRGLDINEQLTLTLAKIRESAFENEYAQMAVFDGQNPKLSDLTVFSGDFELEGTLFSSKELVIDAGCQQVCVEKNSKGDCTRRQPVPESTMTIKNPQIGGVHRNITIKAENLNEKITFYVLRFPQPVCTASQECVLYPCFTLDEMGKADFYSELFKSRIVERYS